MMAGAAGPPAVLAINARPDEALERLLARSDQEAVVINLEIEPAEPPEEVRWIDPNHPQG